MGTLTLKPLELFEGGEGWQVVDEKDDVIFDNQTYYPTHPSREWAERIVAAVNGQDVAMGDFLHRLRTANIARDSEYRAKTQGEPLPLLFRTTEFAGEVGELLNVVKKIERERLGWAGKRADRKMLLEELGGVMATLDLLAMMLSADIAEATTDEFNAVSDRLALSTKL